MGHDVIGVDVSPIKIDLITDGRATVVEERIGNLTSDAVRSGALRAVSDVKEAIAGTEVSLICVGTPSAPNGSLSTFFLERVAEQIGEALALIDRQHTVVVRSTMLPGTCLELLVPILEKYSGKVAGVDFGVAVNPEFLREGTSVRDFFDPPKTVIGEYDVASGDVVARLYEGLPCEVFRVPIPVAEMIKYADNSFHALKIGFANELGAICRALGVDSNALMEVFLADRKLNISPAYLRPGFAFGGSCLPKDLRGLVYVRRSCGYREATDWTLRPLVQARHRRPQGEPTGRAGRATLG
jgi:GDP-mannose 6-dehydrogenase